MQYNQFYFAVIAVTQSKKINLSGMIILKRIYEEIISTIKPAPPETGGILGGINGIVTKFVFDSGIKTKNTGCYYPDIQKLNSVLSEWNYNDVEFYGHGILQIR